MHLVLATAGESILLENRRVGIPAVAKNVVAVNIQRRSEVNRRAVLGLAQPSRKIDGRTLGQLACCSETPTAKLATLCTIFLDG